MAQALVPAAPTLVSALVNMEWFHPEITNAIHRALAEDVGAGDITSKACVEAEARAKGVFLAREDLVVAGAELLPQIYLALGGEVALEIVHASGCEAPAGAVVANVEGRARTLLAAERTALNFLQRLSGIATLARAFVRQVKGTRCRVLDTRKTTPGLRRLEKLAVAAGGATNHRMGLWDAVLIKNNHITAAGGVRRAIERARALGKPVEIEVRSRDELNEALACGADHLLLDNFSPLEVAELVQHIAGRARVEVSGGVTLATVRAYAESGADYVSAGVLTHSARAVDLSFRLVA